MSDREFLANFITEDIYLVQEPGPSTTGPVIVVDEDMTEADRQLLYKIFSSVSIKPPHLNVQDRSENIDPAAEEVYFFGSVPQSKEFYRVMPVERQSLVYCHHLSEIARDQEKKRKLWAVLKQLYPNRKSPEA